MAADPRDPQAAQLAALAAPSFQPIAWVNAALDAAAAAATRPVPAAAGDEGADGGADAAAAATRDARGGGDVEGGVRLDTAAYDAQLSSLVMKLQLLSQDTNDAIEESMDTLLAGVPRATSQLGALQYEAEALGAAFRAVQARAGAIEAGAPAPVLGAAEGGTGDGDGDADGDADGDGGTSAAAAAGAALGAASSRSSATANAAMEYVEELERLDRVRTNMVDVRTRLQEAANWERGCREAHALLAAAAATHGTFDVARAADAIATVRRSAEVLVDMPDGDKRRATVDNMAHRFVELARPQLDAVLSRDITTAATAAAAAAGASADVEGDGGAGAGAGDAANTLQTIVAAFAQLGIRRALVREYARVSVRPVLRSWDAFSPVGGGMSRKASMSPRARRRALQEARDAVAMGAPRDDDDADGDADGHGGGDAGTRAHAHGPASVAPSSPSLAGDVSRASSTRTAVANAAAFAEWLPGFYSELGHTLEHEARRCRHALPGAGVTAPQVTSEIVLQTLPVLEPGFRQRLDEESTLDDVLATFSATRAFARRVAVAVAPTPRRVLRKVLRAVAAPFLWHVSHYGLLERAALLDEVAATSLPGGSGATVATAAVVAAATEGAQGRASMSAAMGADQLSDAAREAEAAVPRVFRALRRAVRRCAHLTAGADAEPFVSSVNDVLNDVAKRLRVLVDAADGMARRASAAAVAPVRGNAAGAAGATAVAAAGGGRAQARTRPAADDDWMASDSDDDADAGGAGARTGAGGGGGATRVSGGGGASVDGRDMVSGETFAAVFRLLGVVDAVLGRIAGLDVALSQLLLVSRATLTRAAAATHSDEASGIVAVGAGGGDDGDGDDADGDGGDGDGVGDADVDASAVSFDDVVAQEALRSGHTVAALHELVASVCDDGNAAVPSALRRVQALATATHGVVFTLVTAPLLGAMHGMAGLEVWARDDGEAGDAGTPASGDGGGDDDGDDGDDGDGGARVAFSVSPLPYINDVGELLLQLVALLGPVATGELQAHSHMSVDEFAVLGAEQWKRVAAQLGLSRGYTVCALEEQAAGVLRRAERAREEAVAAARGRAPSASAVAAGAAAAAAAAAAVSVTVDAGAAPGSPGAAAAGAGAGAGGRGISGGDAYALGVSGLGVAEDDYGLHDLDIAVDGAALVTPTSPAAAAPGSGSGSGAGGSSGHGSPTPALPSAAASVSVSAAEVSTALSTLWLAATARACVTGFLEQALAIPRMTAAGARQFQADSQSLSNLLRHLGLGVDPVLTRLTELVALPRPTLTQLVDEASGIGAAADAAAEAPLRRRVAAVRGALTTF